MPETSIKFSDLKIYPNTSTVDIKINDIPVSVKKYLPMSDKTDLIQIALQKAEEDGIYNEMKLDVYFHLNIIYLYTNLEFSDEDRADEMELYDKLECSDVIDKVIAAIGVEEYGLLKDYLVDMKEAHLSYGNTAAAVLRTFVQDLPRNAAAAKEIMDTFDPNKYQEVVKFAEAANGGRNINTQVSALTPPANE